MIRQAWRVVGGDVRVAVDEAGSWAAPLAVLIAANHHPGTLATRQSATDPADVARQTLAEVVELYAAAAVADARDAEALLGAAMAIGLDRTDAEATVRSGIRAGTAVPRRAPKRPAWRPPGARAALLGAGSPSPARRRERVPDVHPAG